MAGKERSRPDAAVAQLRKRKTNPATATRTIVTRSATRKAAVKAVFLTTELLENILGFPPFKSLLLVQSVCTKWRDTLKRKLFRKRMFLSPVTELKEAWRWSNENSLVVKVEKVNDTTDLMDYLTKISDLICTSGPNAPWRDEGITRRATINPALTVTHEYLGDLIQDRATGEYFRFAWADRLLHHTGSWRSMFVTQPSAFEVRACYTLVRKPTGQRVGPGQHATRGKQFKIKRLSGVTLGDLIDCGLQQETEELKVEWGTWIDFMAECRTCYSDEEVEAISRM